MSILWIDGPGGLDRFIDSLGPVVEESEHCVCGRVIDDPDWDGCPDPECDWHVGTAPESDQVEAWLGGLTEVEAILFAHGGKAAVDRYRGAP
jgi:hypothetical protein